MSVTQRHSPYRFQRDFLHSNSSDLMPPPIYRSLSDNKPYSIQFAQKTIATKLGSLSRNSSKQTIYAPQKYQRLRATTDSNYFRDLNSPSRFNSESSSFRYAQFQSIRMSGANKHNPTYKNNQKQVNYVLNEYLLARDDEFRKRTNKKAQHKRRNYQEEQKHIKQNRAGSIRKNMVNTVRQKQTPLDVSLKLKVSAQINDIRTMIRSIGKNGHTEQSDFPSQICMDQAQFARSINLSDCSIVQALRDTSQQYVAMIARDRSVVISEKLAQLFVPKNLLKRCLSELVQKVKLLAKFYQIIGSRLLKQSLDCIKKHSASISVQKILEKIIKRLILNIFLKQSAQKSKAVCSLFISVDKIYKRTLEEAFCKVVIYQLTISTVQEVYTIEAVANLSRQQPRKYLQLGRILRRVYKFQLLKGFLRYRYRTLLSRYHA